MRVGDLVKIDFGTLRWAKDNGTMGIITEIDIEQMAAEVMTHVGVEMIHTHYLEVVNESR